MSQAAFNSSSTRCILMKACSDSWKFSPHHKTSHPWTLQVQMKILDHTTPSEQCNSGSLSSSFCFLSICATGYIKDLSRAGIAF